jgi:hypothetical protein
LSIWAFATPCKKDGFGNCNIVGPINKKPSNEQLNELCKSSSCANPALYWCGDSNDCHGWGIKPPRGGAYYIFGYDEGSTSTFQQMCPSSPPTPPTCIDGELAACGSNVTPTNWNCCPPRTCTSFRPGEYACQ